MENALANDIWKHAKIKATEVVSMCGHHKLHWYEIRFESILKHCHLYNLVLATLPPPSPFFFNCNETHRCYDAMMAKDKLILLLVLFHNTACLAKVVRYLQLLWQERIRIFLKTKRLLPLYQILILTHPPNIFLFTYLPFYLSIYLFSHLSIFWPREYLLFCWHSILLASLLHSQQLNPIYLFTLPLHE